VPLRNPSQKASANRLGLTQPRLNDLLRGKIDKFSLDAPFDLSGRVGIKVSIALIDVANEPRAAECQPSISNGISLRLNKTSTMYFFA
jgi:hypothetical protein